MPKNQLFRRLASLIDGCLPTLCVLCQHPAQQRVCTDCRCAYFSNKVLRCHQCALALPDDATLCGQCLHAPPAFEFTVSACDYAPPLDKLLWELKFAHKLMLAPLFAQMLADALIAKRSADLPTILCAVPLAPQRLQERGFNQSYEIGKVLANQLGIPLVRDALLRIKETRQQSQLSQLERARNLRHAFALDASKLPDSDHLAELHIGLVDDIMTTGTTVHEIAKMLKRAGVGRVSNYVVARTLTPQLKDI